MTGTGIERARKKVGRPRNLEVAAEATAVEFLRAHSREYAERLHLIADKLYKKLQKEWKRGGETVTNPNVVFAIYKQLHEAASGKPIEQHMIASRGEKVLTIKIEGWDPKQFQLPVPVGGLVEAEVKGEVGEGAEVEVLDESD